MLFKKIQEGQIKLYVPVVDLPEHGRKHGFYNPVMELDRDISVAAISVFKNMFEEKFGKQPNCCDLLCATGIRGLRYAKEICIDEVILNDVNEEAIKLTKRNIKLNKLSNVFLHNKDANHLLAENRFDVIDVDPFGSPYRFIDSCARSLNRFSLFCVTATDCAVLFGVYPDVCKRRYGVEGLRCHFSNEFGVRVLISFLMREFAKYNKCFTPVLSYTRRHYVRVFGIVENDAGKTDKILNEFDYLSYKDGVWKKGIETSWKIHSKIYFGSLHKKEFCNKVIEEIKNRKLSGIKILNTITDEIDEPFYYDLNWLAKTYKKQIQPKNKIIEKLKQNSFKASQTIFCSTGIKTDAGLEQIAKLI